MTTLRPFFDIAFTTGSIDDIVGEIAAAARAPGATMVVTPNVHHVVALETQLADDDRAAYLSADLFLCDSKIIGRLARWSGIELTPRTGTDRVADLLASDESRDLVVALAGPDAAESAALAARYPERRVLRIEVPDRLARDTAAWDAAVTAAAAAEWHVLLSCLSFPKQERFAVDVRAARRQPDATASGGVILCVGAAVDFLSGTIVRAPMAFQRLGLEWLHRLLSDPRRLWRRYLVDGPRIFLLYLDRVRKGRT